MKNRILLAALLVAGAFVFAGAQEAKAFTLFGGGGCGGCGCDAAPACGCDDACGHSCCRPRASTCRCHLRSTSACRRHSRWCS